MKVLLHACCGPCSVVPVRDFRSEDVELFGVFVNPNIHPYTEWKRRLDGLRRFAEGEALRLLPEASYDVTGWLRDAAFREGERCRLCYYGRLRSTALLARRGRFDAFSTTLLYSRFQEHDLIAAVGEGLGTELGIPFLYRDWRERWGEGVRESRALGLYRQQYCGCIYSEQERYAPKGNRNPSGPPPEERGS